MRARCANFDWCAGPPTRLRGPYQQQDSRWRHKCAEYQVVAGSESVGTTSGVNGGLIAPTAVEAAQVRKQYIRTGRSLQACWSGRYKISEITSVDNLVGGVDDAKHIKQSLYQPLQYACRLLLANLVLPYRRTYVPGIGYGP